jgi:secretion/DNA translocation related TadE-like protein
MNRETGNVSVIALAGVALAFVLCLGVARVGGAVVLKSRADTAADAAALAAADALALGHTESDARAAARGAAVDNGAQLVSCTCSGDEAEVTVTLEGAVGRAFGHARAEVDFRMGPTARVRDERQRAFAGTAAAMRGSSALPSTSAPCRVKCTPSHRSGRRNCIAA